MDPGQRREVTQRFLDAAVGGDLDRLLTVLAPDVTLVSDGGGQVKAALRPVTGAAKVARFIAAISARPYQGFEISEMNLELAEINGAPGALVTAGGRTIIAISWLVAGGQVTAIQIISSPDKLAAISAGRVLPL